MRRPALGHLQKIVPLALIASVVTACSPAAVSPLAGQSPSPSPVTAPPRSPSVPSTSPSATPRHRPPATRTSTLPSACLGRVAYRVSTQDALLPGSLCLKAGAVLEVHNIGPGEPLSATPEDKVSRAYEAGVVTIRFVETGSIRVRIPTAGGTSTIRVRVVP